MTGRRRRPRALAAAGWVVAAVVLAAGLTACGGDESWHDQATAVCERRNDVLTTATFVPGQGKDGAALTAQDIQDANRATIDALRELGPPPDGPGADYDQLLVVLEAIDSNLAELSASIDADDAHGFETALRAVGGLTESADAHAQALGIPACGIPADQRPAARPPAGTEPGSGDTPGSIVDAAPDTTLFQPTPEFLTELFVGDLTQRGLTDEEASCVADVVAERVPDPLAVGMDSPEVTAAAAAGFAACLTPERRAELDAAGPPLPPAPTVP